MIFGKYVLAQGHKIVDRYNGRRAGPVELGTRRVAVCDWLRIPSSDAVDL
jgi:hypothetical protein